MNVDILHVTLCACNLDSDDVDLNDEDMDEEPCGIQHTKTHRLQVTRLSRRSRVL
jgi:hypothetical protein